MSYPGQGARIEGGRTLEGTTPGAASLADVRAIPGQIGTAAGSALGPDALAGGTSVPTALALSLSLTLGKSAMVPMRMTTANASGLRVATPSGSRAAYAHVA